MKMSKWKTLLVYLNKFDVGEELRKESLLLAVGDILKNHATVNQYRIVLTKLGYLSDTYPYKIMNKVPTDLVYNQCKEKVYESSTM